MTPGLKYRNNNPSSTYGIKLLSIVHTNEKRIKIKFQFVNKETGALVDYQKEDGRILTEDLNDWEGIH